jgi:general secretion pathway protein E
VLRLLDKSHANLLLEGVGMPKDTQARFTGLLAQPHGIVLVTGPTGSGKTTTLYAALQALDRKAQNIMTVEDPVEYDLSGIGQIQVNARIDLDFARALRSILRQDPDVVMIGEIRDLDTAQIAVQASLTGHLVLATLHTNDAASAIARLVDLGVEPFLLASSLRGVLAQRLVRRLCAECRRPVDTGNAWSAAGCAQCGQTGYAGRTGIFELLVADAPIQSLIHDRGAETDLREAARAGGCRSLREDGLRLVLDGTTSMEELVRVTRD